MRNYVSPIFLAIIIISACFGIGDSYNEISLTLIAGLLSLTIITPTIGYNKHQCLLAILWYCLLLLAYMTNQPYGILLLLSATAIGIYVTVLAVSEAFQGTGLTLTTIVKTLIGEMRAPQTVSPPTNGVADEEEKYYGPRMITVEPDTAAIMFKGSKQTRILGPHEFTSESAEYVKRRFNLKPLHQKYEFQRVTTKDLIATHIIVTLTYGVNVAADARLGERKLNSQEIDSVKRLNSWAANWEEELRSVTEKNVRRAVGEMLLSNATDVSSHDHLWFSIYRRLENDINAWGIKIYKLDIISLKPHKNVTQAREDNWLIDTRTDTLIRNEEARGEAWKRALAQLAEACTYARGQDIPEEVIYRELSRRMFEQAAIDPATRKRLRLDLGNTSADLHSDDQQQP